MVNLNMDAPVEAKSPVGRNRPVGFKTPVELTELPPESLHRQAMQRWR